MKLFLGPPGTGKTTRLVAEVQQAGLHPDQVAYLAFTRKAAEEAASRVGGKFPHFRTIHSMAYRLLGLERGRVMDYQDYREVGRMLNMAFTKWFDAEEAVAGGQTEGDKVRAVSDYARAVGKSGEEIVLSQAVDVNPWRLDVYERTLANYKRDTGKLDFNDMLERCLREAAPLARVKLAVVDEAQDLSPLQWKVVRHLFRDAPTVLVAGDDDQAIFRWAGADVDAFLGLDAEREVLAQSYRVPTTVQEVALSITGQIESRYPKDWASRPETGQVDWVSDPGMVDLEKSGEHLLLARNGYQLRTWVDVCRTWGVTYTLRGQRSVKARYLRAIRAYEAHRRGDNVRPEDLEVVEEYRTGDGIWYEALTGIPYAEATYYRDILRRGGDLDAAPRHHIHTIHGVKGGQADHVALLTDQSRQTATIAERQPDDEHRVFYVGVTRAKESLTVVTPQGVVGYSIQKTS